MAATIRDVARAAGVSTSTVSRVLNQKGTISEETKQRIYQAMENLNYVPNDFARGLATGSPRVIALVIDVADVRAYSNNFFNNTVFGIETTAHRNDYNLMIINGAPAFGGISSVERLVMSKKIDGVIFPVSIVNAGLLKKLDELHFPCVVLGRSEEISGEVNWVDINNTQAGASATRHLLRNGYQNIAFLSDGEDKIFNQDRITGYCRELSHNGLPVDQAMIVHVESSLDAGQKMISELLSLPQPPDAVICSSDRLALGAIRAAREKGLSVPRDFGVLSFDNTSLTELAEPSITSIDMDTFEQGVQAAETLLNQIEDPDISIRQILLSTKTVVRTSTSRTHTEAAYT